MADSHVDMPAPTIVTMFLKPCTRQCASRPSKVNSGITYNNIWMFESFWGIYE